MDRVLSPVWPHEKVEMARVIDAYKAGNPNTSAVQVVIDFEALMGYVEEAEHLCQELRRLAENLEVYFMRLAQVEVSDFEAMGLKDNDLELLWAERRKACCLLHGLSAVMSKSRTLISQIM